MTEEIDIIKDPINWTIKIRDKYWKKKVKKLEFKIKCMYTLKNMSENFNVGYKEGYEKAKEELNFKVIDKLAGNNLI